MTKKTLLACGLVFAASLAARPAHAEEWTPVRKAEAGCKWEAHAYPDKGIRLWFENCKKPKAHYVLSWKKNILEQHRLSDDRTFNAPGIIEVWTKPANESIPQAIADRFIEHLPEEERVGCDVVRDTDMNPPDGVERYRITPSKEYEQEVVDKFKKENPDGGMPYDNICGDHGQFEGNAYFEYHPGQSTEKYLYVTVGQDEPLFDEDSLVIYK